MPPPRGNTSTDRTPGSCKKIGAAPSRRRTPPRPRAPPARPGPRAAAGRQRVMLSITLLKKPGSSVIVMALLTEMVVEGVVRWRASSSRTASPPPACDAVANCIDYWYLVCSTSNGNINFFYGDRCLYTGTNCDCSPEIIILNNTFINDKSLCHYPDTI